MSYTLEINPDGTVVLPLELLEEFKKDGTSKILAIKTKNGYVFRAVKDIMSLGKSIKPKVQLTDEELDKMKPNAFLRSKNIF